MTEVTAISVQSATLLVHYSFDLDSDTAEQLVAFWLANYPPHWLRLAVVEALYQGRYKAVSVEHILAMWQRRGQPLYHFNHEFERLVCSNFFQDFMEETDPVPPLENAVLPEIEAMVAPYCDLPSAIAQEEADIHSNDREELPIHDSEESVLPSDRPSGLTVKHTDFYSKLKSVAQQGKQNKEVPNKQPGERRRRRSKDEKKR